MKRPMNRRMFLRGAGTAAMAIPFLPSLTTRAFAQEAPLPPVGRNFMALCADHGGVWGANQYPSDMILTDTIRYAGRDVRYGLLPTQPDANGRLAWSPVCAAPAQRLTPELTRKFNVLRGLDIPYRISHHAGGHLGNFSDDSAPAGVNRKAYHTATIDQIMAFSDNFYTDADRQNRLTQRSFNLISGHYSQNFSSPSTRSGGVVKQAFLKTNLDVYDYLFSPGSAYNGVDRSILNHVRDAYNRLRRHPRISRGDLIRLDQHVERMAEIERKLVVAQNLANLPQRPATNSTVYSLNHSFWHNPSEKQIPWCDLMCDMVVAAFESGASRVATWDPKNTRFTAEFINDWHGGVAHGGLGDFFSQSLTLGFHQGIFEYIMVVLASKLDAVRAHDGQTLLDHSLITFTSEAGQKTHHSGCVNYPVITAGRAGGYFNTGYYVDYSNKSIAYRDFDVLIATNPNYQAESPGLYYNQWLANALYSMGVRPDEFGSFHEMTNAGPERSAPTGGYGHHHVDGYRAQDYLQAKAVMSDPLPVITNG